jgi:antirestriction protein ArdC
MKTNINQRITDTIVKQPEQGLRPWIKSWNAEHAAGRITRPLRDCGQPYQGINVLALWASATAQGFRAPI